MWVLLTQKQRIYAPTMYNNPKIGQLSRKYLLSDHNSPRRASASASTVFNSRFLAAVHQPTTQGPMAFTSLSYLSLGLHQDLLPPGCPHKAFFGPLISSMRWMCSNYHSLQAFCSYLDIILDSSDSSAAFWFVLIS